MQIVSALFVENFELRQAPGPSTRIDITGAMFSMAAPQPVPVTINPHLVALIWCPPDESGNGVFEVVFRTGPGAPDAATVAAAAGSGAPPSAFPARWATASPTR